SPTAVGIPSGSDAAGAASWSSPPAYSALSYVFAWTFSDGFNADTGSPSAGVGGYPGAFGHRTGGTLAQLGATLIGSGYRVFTDNTAFTQMVLY
ncbi:MAG: hypothetical protein FWD74_07795, partial [Actinomycetia bacterium]|nr:hypothetical protein [Actinomycetes bacterium]